MTLRNPVEKKLVCLAEQVWENGERTPETALTP